MSELLVRDLDPGVIERLKQRANRHGRSLQGEAKAILEAAATFSTDESRQAASRWRERLAGTMKTDSADLIAQDRKR